MTKYMLISVAGIILALIGGYLWTSEQEGRSQQALFHAHDGKKSITFIMGEDKTDQPFYRLAAEHFALDETEKTDYVVHTCRTLGQVIDYLNNSLQRGTQPWSVVNVVAHGNPQTGLNLFITEGGHKATPKRLVQAVLRQDLPRLKAGIVDRSTRINFWSCGIGKSPLVNLALKRMFKPGGGDSARVYCSPHFVIFHPSSVSQAPYRLKASYWPYYFKRGYRPGDLEIAEALRTQHPDVQVDWQNALRKTHRTSDSEAYHGEYHIPVTYLKIYENKHDRPDFQSAADKVAWALSQETLQEQIAETGIPVDRFQWTVNKVIHTSEDGTRVPAVKAIGMATVLYVLREESRTL